VEVISRTPRNIYDIIEEVHNRKKAIVNNTDHENKKQTVPVETMMKYYSCTHMLFCRLHSRPIW